MLLTRRNIVIFWVIDIWSLSCIPIIFLSFKVHQLTSFKMHNVCSCRECTDTPPLHTYETVHKCLKRDSCLFGFQGVSLPQQQTGHPLLTPPENKTAKRLRARCKCMASLWRICISNSTCLKNLWWFGGLGFLFVSLVKLFLSCGCIMDWHF